MANFRDRMQKRLKTVLDQDRYRFRKRLDSSQQVNLTLNGKSYLSFCSNDYLGLASDPDVRQALINSAKKYGTGSGASHLITGHHAAHERLEEALCEWSGAEACLLFSTGYMANLAIQSALLNRHDHVFHDRLNHASLLDGAVLSRAKLHRFPHADYQRLDEQLLTVQIKASEQLKMVVTDGVFSMDGDVADLKALVDICNRHEAVLAVDDAHGFGVLGEKGKGLVSSSGFSHHEVPLQIGTLGKAFGTSGAFVLGEALTIDYLTQFSRSYIYTTATPPAIADATLVALEKVIAGDDLRMKLNQHIVRFKGEMREMGFSLMPSDSPIQPVLVGECKKALEMSKQLEAQGILVTPIRPPTVPEGEARLRVTMSAQHTEADLDRLLSAFNVISEKASL